MLNEVYSRERFSNPLDVKFSREPIYVKRNHIQGGQRTNVT